VLPDGSLFGEGVKTRLKEHLMEECNLQRATTSISPRAITCWSSNSAGGDALELIALHKPQTNGEAIEWARQWIGTLQCDVKCETEAATQADEPTDANAAADAPPSDDAAARQTKIADILTSCKGVAGTPAELYLRNRGITEACSFIDAATKEHGSSAHTFRAGSFGPCRIGIRLAARTMAGAHRAVPGRSRPYESGGPPCFQAHRRRER
jgi:hypothetical protein